MVKVTPRTKGLFKVWLFAYVCFLGFALTGPPVQMVMILSFVVLGGSMLLTFLIKQHALLSHLEQYHPKELVKMNSTPFSKGLHEFYRNPECFDDPELLKLKLDYQSVLSWYPWLPLNAVMTISIITGVSGRMG